LMLLILPSLSRQKSAELVQKLAFMTSKKQSEALTRNIYVNERVKPSNEQIYYLVDNINSAINSEKKISFKYFHYDQHRKEAPNNEGKRYRFSPYHLVWSDDHYYVIGYCEKHRKIATYRVDHMKEVTILEATAIPAPEDYNLPDFARQVFDMYDGDKEKVTLFCKNNLMNYIVDRFGDEVETTSTSCGQFKAIAEVSVSPTFLAWIFQFNGDIKIVAPKTVASRYEEMLRNALK